MDDKLSAIGVISGLFALIGLGIGILALVGISWVPAELVVEVDGVVEGLVGFIIVGILLFMLGLFILFVNPLITLIIGTILGEFNHAPLTVLKICVTGSFIGFFLMIGLTMVTISVGVWAGAGTAGIDLAGAFDLNMAMVGVLSVMSVLTAIFGGVAGFLGSVLSLGSGD